MQRILVTGTSRGIGQEFVRQYLQRGERVFATCRKPGLAHELTKLALAHPGRLTILPLDQARPASVVELDKELALVTDTLDVLINNAGVLVSGERWGALETKALTDTFAVNVVGPVLLAQQLMPLLERGSNPRVVNLSSTLGCIARTDSFVTPSYSVSKAALNMATRQIAAALGPRGIVTIAISPGWVKTDMGGPNAQIEATQSVRDMIGVIDRIQATDNSSFCDHDGGALPW